ncbi:MAG: hypothetical protein LBU80_02135, partial [Rikenellaceae bacterium]|nr:hypothetical protein [Rikenellaceae bacterium]
FTSSALESDKLYWLYARVPKTGTADGTFAVTTDERPFDTDPDYYNLLVGALNSEYDGDRSYSSLYGFTEVLPGQIVVNLIRSNDGQNYIDFLKNAVRIGNQNSFIDWNSLQDNIFRIRGAIVQSPSGAEDVIGVNRGTWLQNVTYYKGDEVLYNGATYRYVNSGSSAGVQPDLYPTYWQVRAAKGNDGRIFSYRGEYDGTKSYTGNAQVAQVVKVGAQFYYTDANAGTFSGVQPPNANYWTSYGANFESVATGLLLAEKALIAGFNFDNEKIESSKVDISKPAMLLDGKNGKIELNSLVSKWQENTHTDKTILQTISLDSQSGVIRSDTGEGDAAYLNSQGIFANRAGINAVPPWAGLSVKASIVGLGFGNMNKTVWRSEAVVGVYGSASNNSSNPAPAFGGWFNVLKANGLVLSMVKASGQTAGTTYLTKTQNLFVSGSSALQTVYLPSDAYEGAVVYLKQWMTGTTRIYPPSGQKLFDDSSENTYVDLGQARAAICIYIGDNIINYVTYKCWLINVI